MKFFLRMLIFSAFFIILNSFESFSVTETPTVVFQASCDANQNLDETCRKFIGRCRKGGINSEFPGQFYDVKIREVKAGNSANHKRAWKLLNDSRFKK